MTTQPPPLDVRAIRERLGLTGQAFADRINQRVPGARTNRNTVSRWERGISTPDPAMQAIIRTIAEEHQSRETTSTYGSKTDPIRMKNGTVDLRHTAPLKNGESMTFYWAPWQTPEDTVTK